MIAGSHRRRLTRALAAAALVALAPGCLDGPPSDGGGGTDGDSGHRPVVSGGRTGSIEPFAPPGTSTATVDYLPDAEEDTVVSVWKSRVTMPAGALADPATLTLTMIPGGLTATPTLIPVSPLVAFRADDADGLVARSALRRNLIADAIVDRNLEPRDTIVLVIIGYGTEAEARYAIGPQDLTVTLQDDGSRLVSFETRDTELAFAVAGSPKGVVPPGYAAYPALPRDVTGLTALAAGTADEPTEVTLTWTPDERPSGGYRLAVAAGDGSPDPGCEGGTDIPLAAVTTAPTTSVSHSVRQSFLLTGQDERRLLRMRLCTLSPREPADASPGTLISYALPARATARLKNAPPAMSNLTALAVKVEGAGVTTYRYARLTGDSTTCDGAAYSEWRDVAQTIDDPLTEGPHRLCVLGRKSERNEQRTPTTLAWTVDLQAPGAFSMTPPTTPTNDATPTVVWSAASGASRYDVRFAKDAACTTVVQTVAGVTATTATAAALPDDSYYVCVTALDAAGNATPATNDGRPLVIDATPPVLTALPLANQAADGFLNAAERSATGDLAGGLVATGHTAATYALAAASVPCNGSLTYGAMPKSNAAGFGADGVYKVCVKLVDALANTSYGASPTFRLDVSLPAFTSLARAGAAADGYVNATERGANQALVGVAAGSGHDTVDYALAADGTTCDDSLTYGPSPRSNTAPFGADGPYIVCARLRDGAGNPPAYGASPAFTLDTEAPEITALTSSTPDGTYGVGALIQIEAAFSESVVISGTSGETRLLLETGATDRYAASTATSGSGTSLVFDYTVADGDEAAALDLVAVAPHVSFVGNVRIKDVAGNVLALSAAGATPLSASAALHIDGVPPSPFTITQPGALTSDDTPETAWTDPGDADEVMVEIGDEADCPSPLESWSGPMTTTFTAAHLDDGDYVVCVTLRDAVGNGRKETLAFTVETGTWAPVTPDDAPVDRTGATVVWDSVRGQAVVWGGRDGGGGYLADGGRYAPSDPDAWMTTATADGELPQGREEHTATWTGTAMVVWGGWNGAELAEGGVYDPDTDDWTAVTMDDEPTPRRRHSAVWDAANGRVIVWGGRDANGVTADGGAYDPAGNAWTSIPDTAPGAPVAREAHTAVWDDVRGTMIVWGGRAGAALDDGAVYDPATGEWTALPSLDAPSARYGHTAIWTGEAMIVFGGTTDGSQPAPGGAIYLPSEGEWRPLATDGMPAARFGHTAVWDGAGGRMLVWGGTADGASALGDGAVYSPAGDSWTVPRMDAGGAPSARSGHAAVWSPTVGAMVLFGGEDAGTPAGGGGRFTPP